MMDYNDEDLIRMIRYDGDRSLKQLLQQTENELQDRPGARIRRFPRRLLAVAAAALLLLVAGLWYMGGPGDRTDDYLSDYFEPYPNRAVNLTRGTPDDLRTRAFSAYEAGEFSAALQAMEELQLNGPDDVLDFYRANALLAMGRAAEARPLLDRLTESPDFPLPEQARWYAALAALATEDFADARRRLERLTDSPQAFNRDQALRILEAIP